MKKIGKTYPIIVFTTLITATALLGAYWNITSESSTTGKEQTTEKNPKENKKPYDYKDEIKNLQKAIQYNQLSNTRTQHYLKSGIKENALNIVQQKKLESYISFLDEQKKLFTRQIDHLLNPNLNQQKIKLTFKDVFGMEREKNELQDLLTFFNSPKTLVNSNQVKPRGYLLYGPPGTGKTFLVKALCNEADVHFINLTPATFDKKYVGEGKQALDDVWAEAEKFEKTIIFFDEIDGFANRTTYNTNAVSKNILNDLLNKMDGFKDRNDKIVVMGATNILETIDPALRSRFSKEIKIDLMSNESIFPFLKHLIQPYSTSFYTYNHLYEIANRCKDKKYSKRDLVMLIENAYKKTCKYYNMNPEHNVILPSDLNEAFDLKQSINKTVEEINNERIACEKEFKSWEDGALKLTEDKDDDELGVLTKPRIIPNPLTPVPSLETINKVIETANIPHLVKVGVPGFKLW